MKKLVFKEWLECVVVMLFFISFMGIGFGAICSSQTICVVSGIVGLIQFGLLALFGRTF